MSSTTKRSEPGNPEVGTASGADLLPEEMEAFLHQAVGARLVSPKLAKRYRRELVRWVAVLAAVGVTIDAEHLDAEQLTTQRLAAALVVVGWSNLPRQEREKAMAPLEGFCRWMVQRGRMPTNPFIGLRTGGRWRSQTERFAE